MMRIGIFMLSMVLAISSAFSQSLAVDEVTKRWEGGGSVGLDNDGFELDLRGLFFFNQYVGLKLGIGCAGELWTLEDWNEAQEWPPPYYDYTYSHTYAMRFRLNPAVALRSPALFEYRNWDAAFHLFAEPGMTYSPGSAGSRNARTVCWDVKAGVNMQMGRYVVTLGYGISDFSLYSGSPDSYWSQPGKKDYLTHTVFVGFAVKFSMGRGSRKPRIQSPYVIDGIMMPEF